MASGEHAREYWPLSPRFGIGWGKSLAAGEMVRLQMVSALDGYWSDASRMLVMGDPSPQQKAAYEQVVTLRNVALEQIRPEVAAHDVYRAIREAADAHGIDLVDDLGVGHGVGVTAYEPPYLNASDGTILRAGMVLVLDLITRRTNWQLLRSKDTLVVTEDGCRIVGWYKDWREPYRASQAFPA